MKTWSFYDAKTGEFQCWNFTGNSRHLSVNTPEGCVAIEGEFSPLRSKFNVAENRVEAFIPNKPDDTDLYNHSWDDREWKWIKVKTLAAIEIDVRQERDKRLSDCDWTQIADADLTQSEKADWREYRKKLRDIPDQPGFPTEINWPESP